MTLIRLLAPLLLLGPLLVVAGPLSPSPAEAAPVGASIRVATANVREGSIVRRPADRRYGTDRRAFARRLLGRATAPPDVVAVQEVLGSARKVARALNAFQRTRDRAGRYAVATGTAHRFATGRCDGQRTGRFSLLRSSSLLVNRKTVTEVHGRGTIRTWGRWTRKAWPETGRKGHGCTEHPWVRVTVRAPDGPRTARVLSAHVAPAGRGLKTRAIDTLRRGLDHLHRRTPADLAVLGGDLNMNRCVQAFGRGEKETCRVRPAHQRLINAGYRDVVRAVHDSGPAGVVGAARRIDFLYARASPAAAWWDRCYQAYLVKKWKCGTRSVFAQKRAFWACEGRVTRRRGPGGDCSRRMFLRYYSDHPVVLGTVR